MGGFASGVVTAIPSLGRGSDGGREVHSSAPEQIKNILNLLSSQTPPSGPRRSFFFHSSLFLSSNHGSGSFLERLSLQRPFDVVLHPLLERIGGGITSKHPTVPTDQKLGVIPRYLSVEWFLLEERVHRSNGSGGRGVVNKRRLPSQGPYSRRAHISSHFTLNSSNDLIITSFISILVFNSRAIIII